MARSNVKQITNKTTSQPTQGAERILLLHGDSALSSLRDSGQNRQASQFKPVLHGDSAHWLHGDSALWLLQGDSSLGSRQNPGQNRQIS
ncbi:MAG TPA: hypothetical protein DCF63_11695 [Planctomycetaceae bacterium]|nr:hypothetical protein [Planctomycetaceae bacterium]